jgi:hypothetical protein
MSRHLHALVAVAVAVAPFLAPLPGGSSATAAPQQPAAAERAHVLQSLVDCRRITADAARLACFDHATAVLDEAEKTGEVVVVDQSRVREVKRQAFGLTLPSLSLFSGNGGAAHDEPLKRVELTIDASREVEGGRYRITTTEGATWLQTDGDLAFPPRKGQSLVITPGMLGSFFCHVNNQPAVRCRREN